MLQWGGGGDKQAKDGERGEGHQDENTVSTIGLLILIRTLAVVG